jgi:beta-glucosidase
MITDPRFGRLQEGYSENPILTAHLGEAAVLGLQNGAAPLSYLDNTSVAALGKHYAAYGSPQGGLNGGPAIMSKRTLYEQYLRPWKKMAAAGLRAVMPAHNTVLDVPCHANEWLINDVLRDAFGFGKGVALSDCNDIGVLADFRIAANRSHAAALALKAGVDWDLQCGTDPQDWGYNALPQALKDGLISLGDIDTTVRRVLTHKFAAGLFDQGPVDADKAISILDAPAHRSLAREAAEQSIVLLKNKGDSAVPLVDSGDAGLKIALLGPTASSDCNCTEATFSLIGSYALPGARVVTLDQALRAMPGANHSIEWAPGMASAANAPGTGQDATALADAVALANRSDVAILILGDIEGQSNGGCGEWGDRDSLDLQGGQLALLNAVSTVAKKTIVILVHGRPQTFGAGNSGLDGVDALFAAWRPGEEFGNAMTRLLFGHVSPSGKLAQSWPRSVGQVGGGANPWLQRVRGKWLANAKGAIDPDGRRYDDYLSSATQSPTPLFYFGHGLSYSKFTYDKLVVTKGGRGQGEDEHERERAAAAVLWTAHVTLTNVGAVAATEVVQVYIQDPAGLPFVPFWKRLVGFGRVELAPGESKMLGVDLLREDVSMYSNGDAPKLTLYPGEYTVMVGGSSYNTTLSEVITVP